MMKMKRVLLSISVVVAIISITSNAEAGFMSNLFIKKQRSGAITMTDAETAFKSLKQEINSENLTVLRFTSSNLSEALKQGGIEGKMAKLIIYMAVSEYTHDEMSEGLYDYSDMLIMFAQIAEHSNRPFKKMQKGLELIDISLKADFRTFHRYNDVYLTDQNIIDLVSDAKKLY